MRGLKSPRDVKERFVVTPSFLGVTARSPEHKGKVEMRPSELTDLAEDLRSKANDLDDYDTPDTFSCEYAIIEYREAAKLAEKLAEMLTVLERRKNMHYAD